MWNTAKTKTVNSARAAADGAITETERVPTAIERMDLTSAGTNLMNTWATGIRAGTASPNPDELIETVTLPLSRALEMIRDGEIRDGKTIVALLYLAGFRLNF